MALKSPPISSCALHRPRTALLFSGDDCPLCELIETLVQSGVRLPETEEGIAAMEYALIPYIHPEDD